MKAKDCKEWLNTIDDDHEIIFTEYFSNQHYNIVHITNDNKKVIITLEEINDHE